jgi:hypothetical protein
MVRMGAWLVLLMAMMPNVLYVGHWPTTGAADGHVHAHAPAPPAETEHAEHCHGDTSQCDAPSLVLVTWVIGESSVEEPPSSLLVPMSPAAPAVEAEIILDVSTPPPRQLS